MTTTQCASIAMSAIIKNNYKYPIPTMNVNLHD